MLGPKRLSGGSYSSGFFIQDSELNITEISKNIDSKKIHKEDRLFRIIFLILYISAVLLFIGFMFYGLCCSDFGFGFGQFIIETPLPIFLLIIFCIFSWGSGCLYLFYAVLFQMMSVIWWHVCKEQCEYHATEHKVIALLGANLPVTIENLRGASSFSPRCSSIKGLPKFLGFVERLTLKEPSEEKLNEGIEVAIKYYIRATRAIKRKMEALAATENKS